MSTALSPFDYAGQQVRVVTNSDDEPWFVAADVARILGYRDAHNMARRVDDEDRGTHSLSTPGGDQTVATLSEAGLYAAILGSQIPGARAFKRWVVRDVLPAIRRTGSYNTAPVPTEVDAAMLRQIAAAMEAKDQRIAELEPKEMIADRLLDAEGDLSVADAAKELTRAGIKVGAGRLFTLLAGMHWTYRDRGDGRWRVYQAAIDGGWMSVLPQSHYHPKTGVLVLDPPQPRVTPKGIARLLADHGASERRELSAVSK